MMFFRKRQINELQVTMARDDIIRRSRILIVDDEKPSLIEDLQRAHFSVDYRSDIGAQDLEVFDKPLYDLVLLDFGDVGRSLGKEHGLSILRHIKRVNPATVVYAYTSKSLSTEFADFYRKADGVLAKDAGISDSMEKIEEGLRRARTPERLWSGLLEISGTEAGSARDREWQDLLIKGISRPRKLRALKERVRDAVTSEAALKVAILVIEKLIEAAMRSGS